MKRLQDEIASLKENPDFQRDLEFKENLEALMKEYDASDSFVLKIVAPEAYSEEKKTKTVRKPRKLKVYTNPHTGEVVETRGGNQKQLKAWKDEHGKDEVESWAIIPDDEEAKQEEPKPAQNEEAKQEEPKIENNPETNEISQEEPKANDEEATDNPPVDLNTNQPSKSNGSGKKGKSSKGKSKAKK